MLFSRRYRGPFLLSLLMALVLASVVCAQEKSKIISGNDPDKSESFVKEVEPGVWVYGRPHRFAEVGPIQSFDTSPDGRTIVFLAGGQLKFFDLVENKVVGTVANKSGSFSNTVEYSSDGRLVFTISNQYTRESGQVKLVYIIDAITHTIEGNVNLKIEDEEDASSPWRNFWPQHCKVSPDSKYVAVASHNAVQVRDVDTGDLVFEKSKMNYVRSIAFVENEDSTRLVLCNFKPSEIDLETGEEFSKSRDMIAKPPAYSSIAISLSTGMVASCSNQSLTLRDLASGKTRTLRMPTGFYGQEIDCFSDDGSLVSARTYYQKDGENAFKLLIFDVESGKIKKELEVASNHIQRVRFSIDNSKAYVAGNGIYGVLEIDLNAPDEKLAEQKYPSGPMKSAIIANDGESFLTLSEGGQITWFDQESGEVTNQLQKSGAQKIVAKEGAEEFLTLTQWGNNDAFSRSSYKDGKHLSGYRGRATKQSKSIFSTMRQFALNKTNNIQQAQATAMDSVWAEDGGVVKAFMREWLYEVKGGFWESKEYEQRSMFSYNIFEADSGKLIHSKTLDPADYGFSKHEWVQHGGVHPTEDQMFFFRAGKIFVVDAQSGETILEQKFNNGSHVYKLVYSPDGRFIVATTHQALQVLDSQTGEEVFRLDQKNGTQHFCFSRDGHRMAVAPSLSSRPIVVFETNNWKEIYSRPKSEAHRKSIALSENGDKLLVGLSDCRMELIRVK